MIDALGGQEFQMDGCSTVTKTKENVCLRESDEDFVNNVMSYALTPVPENVQLQCSDNVSTNDVPLNTSVTLKDMDKDMEVDKADKDDESALLFSDSKGDTRTKNVEERGNLTKKDRSSVTSVISCNIDKRKRNISEDSSESDTSVKSKTQIRKKAPRRKLKKLKQSNSEEVKVDKVSMTQKTSRKKQDCSSCNDKRNTNSAETNREIEDTPSILNAITKMEDRMSRQFDELKLKNENIIKHIQEEINHVRDDFNKRIDGLAKKIET